MTEETPQVELTDKQKLFVEFYLMHMNATMAAKLAGYSQKTAYSIGHENLKKPEIRAAVDAALAERVMGKDELLSRLADMARGDMREFIGKSAAALKKHPDGRLIKKFERTVTTTSIGNDGERVEEKVKVELYDAQAALVQLGRYLGLFVDRHELTGKDGEPLPSPVVYLPAVTDDDSG